MDHAEITREGQFMNVLTRYIVIEIIKGSTVALILLWTLSSLFTLADELKDMGKGITGWNRFLLIWP